MTGAPEWLVPDLLRVEQVLRAAAGASAHPMVAEPSLHLIEAGGKRLRPALVMLSTHAGETGRRSSDLAAAAVELVHLATLYHDDVIDETKVRRGVDTAHSRWGIEIAVLAGDYLFASGCALGADAGGDVPSILARALAEVCEGQIVETAALNDPYRSVSDYMETIRLKTASLFRAACEMGAATAGADAMARASLATYGENLGLAFQVVDDLLDLVGDPDITGKTPGTDLREGVFTAPVLMACSDAPDLADRLKREERDLEAALPFLRATGAIDRSMELASSLASDAVAALSALPDDEWTRGLATIADGVIAQVPARA